MVDPEVVKHQNGSASLTLDLETLEESLELLGVVAGVKDLKVHQAALLADSPDNSDRRAAVLEHAQLHARPEPAPRHLVPQMKGGLVEVDDLVVVTLFDEAAQTLDEIELLLLEGQVLCSRLPVCIVGTLILHAVSRIVSPQCCFAEFIQAQLILYSISPQLETQVRHASQGLGVDQPLDLLRRELLLSSRPLGLIKHVVPRFPSLDDRVLGSHFDTCPPEDIHRAEESLLIA